MTRTGRRVAGAAACAVVTAGVVTAGGLALAQSADEEVHACVSAQNGGVRIVDDGEQCRPNEEARTWAVEGPAGPVGPQGPQGEKGDKGDPGGTAGPAAPTPVGLLTIAGAPGSPVVVLGASHGITNTGSSHVGGGMGAGKASVQDLTVTKQVDAVTTDLLESVTLGKHFPSATLTLCSDVAQCAETATYSMTMTEVLVTSVATSAAGGPPTESVSLTFAKVDWAAGGGEFGYDAGANR